MSEQSYDDIKQQKRKIRLPRSVPLFPTGQVAVVWVRVGVAGVGLGAGVVAVGGAAASGVPPPGAPIVGVQPSGAPKLGIEAAGRH